MKVSSLFSSHMVLQSGRPAPVWGWGAAGDAITVGFAGQTKTALCGTDGKWTVTLDPMPACSEPRELTVRSQGENRVETLVDVLVGEVWLASGQSNMEWPLTWSSGGDAAVAAAEQPAIRLLAVPARTRGEAQPDIEASWKVCSPAAVWPFSAVAYYFGRQLHSVLGVPIGLIGSSKGGTRIEAWTSREALLSEPPGKRAVDEYEIPPQDPAERRERALLAKDPAEWLQSKVPADPGNGGFARGWAAAGVDPGEWEEMAVPSKWQSHGHLYSGVFWFRRVVEVPAAWAGRDLVLSLGACDKHDTTYFNNTQVGATSWEVPDAWCTARVYRIPGELVRPGNCVIATRIYSYMTDGGLIGPPEKMWIAPAGEEDRSRISLTGKWSYKVEHNFGPQPAPQQPLGPGNPNTPSILFENMVRPLAPAALAGVIWYQGESNAQAPRDYRVLFPLMIRDWRGFFQSPDLPFYFVQLANYGAPQRQPVEDGWACLREAQTLTLRVPRTGMAVSIDIGEGADIHPKNKEDVGRRLALVALSRTYGVPGPFSGPIYESHTVEGGSVRLRFQHAEGGLKTGGGHPPGPFAIAGADGVFEPAEARIEGETIVVHSERVPNPAAVRYAWADNPPANLYNSADLPASPFRTDLD